MNTQELTTWQRLLNLDLDAADAALPFSKRLARENRWSESFAEGAIEEYRKFCFLALHAGHPVTPSDEVDQVWHLHMLYSRHYWDALCGETLGMPLHHGPTQGGAAEGRKFHAWYERTLDAYRCYFGEPPEDFWPTPRERFDARHDFVRVDRRDVVTFDRARLRAAAGAAAVGAGVLAMAEVFAQAHSSGARSSGGFAVAIVVVLVVLLVAAGAALLGGRAAPRKRRRSHDAAGVAFAGGGSGANHCPPGSAADSGGHCADGGGASGCGGGGGGGCGGGGGGGCGGGGGS